MVDDFDDNKFICLIKKKQGVWNSRSQEYGKVQLQRNVWRSICAEMIPEFYSKSNREKSEIVVKLKQRWKWLRSKFFKYRDSIKTTTPNKRRRYKTVFKYYEQLLFLNDFYDDNKKVQDGNTNDLDSGDSDEETVCKDNIPSSMDTPTETRATRPNEDKLFLMSIITDFKTVGALSKLDARLDILNVIKRYRNESQMNNNDINEASRNRNETSLKETEKFLISLLNIFEIIPEEDTLNAKRDILNTLIKYIKTSSSDIKLEEIYLPNDVEGLKTKPNKPNSKYCNNPAAVQESSLQFNIPGNGGNVAANIETNSSEYISNDVFRFTQDHILTTHVPKAEASEILDHTEIPLYYDPAVKTEEVVYTQSWSNNVFMASTEMPECNTNLAYYDGNATVTSQYFITSNNTDNPLTIPLETDLMTNYSHNTLDEYSQHNSASIYVQPTATTSIVGNEMENVQIAGEQPLVDNAHSIYSEAPLPIGVAIVADQQATLGQFVEYGTAAIKSESSSTTPMTIELANCTSTENPVQYNLEPSYYLEDTMQPIQPDAEPDSNEDV